MARRKKFAGAGWTLILLVAFVAYWLGRSSEPPPVLPSSPGQTAEPQAKSPSQQLEASPVAPAATQVSATLYVKATSLNVRSSPSTEGAKVGELALGTAVGVLESRGDWIAVATPSGIKGWVHGDYLSTRPVVAEAVAPKPAQVAAPAYNRNDVIRAIISASLASYSGNCPCPENRDRAGRRCGKRSAYLRGGGAAPLCYPADVTDAMIQNYLARH